MILNFDSFDKDILVIGGGLAAYNTVCSLVESGAVVTLMAKRESLCKDLLAQIGSGEFAWFNRIALPRDIEGKGAVFNFDDHLPSKISDACKAKNVLLIDPTSPLQPSGNSVFVGGNQFDITLTTSSAAVSHLKTGIHEYFSSSVIPFLDQVTAAFHGLSTQISQSNIPVHQQKELLDHIASTWSVEDIANLSPSSVSSILENVENEEYRPIASNFRGKGPHYQKLHMEKNFHRSFSQSTAANGEDSNSESEFAKPLSPPSSVDTCPDVDLPLLNDLPRFRHREANSVVSASDAVCNVAYQLSAMTFVYPGLTRNHVGVALDAWSEVKKKNLSGSTPKVINLLSTPSSGNSVLGAMQSGESKVSVVLSSAALGHLVPSMFGFARQSLAPVFHVAASSFDEDLVLHHGYSDVLKAAHTGFVLLASTSLQEAQDMAILSHLLAEISNTPVLHFFDGALLANQKSPLQSISEEQLLTIIKETSAIRSNNGDPLMVFDHLAEKLSVWFGKVYRPFEYYGSKDAKTVFVSIGLVSSFLAEACGELNHEGISVGFLNIRIFRPWSVAALLSCLPKTASHLVIVEEGQKSSLGALMAEIQTTLYSTDPQIDPILTSATFENHLESLNPRAVKSFVSSYLDGSRHQLSRISFIPIKSETDVVSDDALVESIFWDSMSTGSIAATQNIAVDHQEATGSFLQQSYVQHLSIFPQPGTVTHIRLGKFGGGEKMQRIHLIDQASLVMCNSVSLAQDFNFAGAIRYSGNLFINSPLSKSEILQSLPNCVTQELFEKRARIYLLDAELVSRNFTIFYGSAPEYLSEILAAIFYHLSFSDKEAHRLLEKQKQRLLTNAKQNMNIFHSQCEAILFALKNMISFTVLELDLKGLQGNLDCNQGLAHYVSGTVPSFAKLDVEEPSKDKTFRAASNHEALLPIIFPSAFNLAKKFRPDLDDVHTVKVSENIRLTPVSYERNVFHMELDISGTDIKYDIGTALGVYPQNDPQRVATFLDEHGFNGKQLIFIDRCNDEGVHSSELRSFEQLLIKSLDIFGKPGKKFYQFLALHAKEDGEKEKIASILKTSESLEEFVEHNTPTFADLLKLFPSVKLNVEQLVRALPAIKPRLYSISSSQRMHPHSIHLLVVLVDWTCKADGSVRYGQATNFLVNLKIGDEITVCLKPSVMRLPPSLEAPVIMAGLGTGMAPFRAFVEERLYWKRKGHKVGPMALYFGSRNRANEYLYGEELEAYHSDGLLTHLRLAFSRDQPEKVYIQNHIQQDSDMLHDLIVKKGGSFYLCGPTWPVPDVSNALLYAFSKSMSQQETRKFLDTLKEHERFVLEVY